MVIEMAQMVKPWPEGLEANRLPTRERALRLLDRLDITPDDPMNSLLRKEWFVNRVVMEWVLAQRRRQGIPIAMHSDEALAAEPELAQGWSEAWEFALRQGWLGDDPLRRRFVYV